VLQEEENKTAETEVGRLQKGKKLAPATRGNRTAFSGGRERTETSSDNSESDCGILVQQKYRRTH